MSEGFDNFMRQLLMAPAIAHIAARRLKRDLTDPIPFQKGALLKVSRTFTAFSLLVLKVEIDIPISLQVGDEVTCTGRDESSQLSLVYEGNVAAFAKERVPEKDLPLLLGHMPANQLGMFVPLEAFGGPTNIHEYLEVTSG